MAIKISNLEQIVKQVAQKEYVFKDLHLDFSKSTTYDPTVMQQVEGNDIKVDYDTNAIRNSLRNLFNTRPGQRFLFPLYGMDLNQFLFESITEPNARILGETIVRSIKTYEPRVKVEECNVYMKPDENTYEITIIISIPRFNTSITINTSLDTKTQNFIFLENN